MDSRSTEGSKSIDKLQMRFDEKHKALEKLLEERDNLDKLLFEEKKNMEFNSRKHIEEVLGIIKPNPETGTMREQLDLWGKELEEHAAFINNSRKILAEEKEEIDGWSTLIQELSMRQKEAGKSDSSLLKEHQTKVASENPWEPGLLSTKERLDMELEQFKQRLHSGRYYERRPEHQNNAEGTSANGKSST